MHCRYQRVVFVGGCEIKGFISVEDCLYLHGRDYVAEADVIGDRYGGPVSDTLTMPKVFWRLQ